jgi:hypothetical protein
MEYAGIAKAMAMSGDGRLWESNGPGHFNIDTHCKMASAKTMGPLTMALLQWGQPMAAGAF